MNARGFWLVLLMVVLGAAVLSLTSCGSNAGGLGGDPGAVNCGGCGNTGGGGSTGGAGSTTNGAVTVTLLDPPTCASPRTTSNHLYLSVAGVQLNPDANATADSTGWVDIQSTLGSAPLQIDMFNAGTTIGNLLTSQAPTGTYGSLRLFLASNTGTVSGNQCASSGVNCITTATTITPIFLATETSRGIVVNGKSISNSSITVSSSGTNINLLFDTCSSLIPYSGGYRMLPQLRAWTGNVQIINVTVSDIVSASRIGTGQSIVALEQADSNGVDQIFTEAAPDGTGSATLYAAPGTYDVVAVAQGTSGGATPTMYSPLVVTGVGGSGGTTAVALNLTPQGAVSPGFIQQTVNSGATVIDTRLSVTQTATISGVQTKPYTIPVLNGLAATIPTTTTPGACSGSACETSALSVPAQPIYVQAFGTLTQNVSSAPTAYTLIADAFRSQFAGVTDCTTITQQTSSTASGTISPAPGGTATANTLTFAGCQ